MKYAFDVNFTGLWLLWLVITATDETNASSAGSTPPNNDPAGELREALMAAIAMFRNNI